MRAAPHVLLVLVVACTTPDADPRPTTEPTPTSTNTTPIAGPGLGVGPTPDFATPDHPQASLERAGVTVVAHADGQLKVRVEFSGFADEQGLNYAGGVGADSCDELLPEVKEIAVLDDGRWIVDAQMACRTGEDYFSATNEHALLIVDAARKRAELLWAGVDTGSNAMGVCVSSKVTSYVVDGPTLRIVQTEVTTLDSEAAKQLPAAAEGCKPKAEHTQEVAAIDLAQAP